ncbi:NAD(+) diphosphatase [Phycicoccus endophyticus]|uniref:NAD(+) diphosphatase n=1 Tax=Phycicoccus endophyticus TaxID=1690220 RepID=UPI00140D58DC|nr:NAD(+) diphosphatase [Phycicoccus endophyticus]NHI20446.1 NAD(+) diphosphatase [Phycicoccus endophyticus]GGL30694.1 NTP pyrophosphohydrolase [Phycicoccus endophyticus]
MARADHSLAPVALTRRPLDRHGELRGDPALLTDRLADPATRVLHLRGDTAPVTEGPEGTTRVRLRAPTATDADHLVVYLGEADGTHYLGVVEDLPEGAEPAPEERTLRQVGASLDDVGAALFVTTLALANWHRTHRFCPRCGGRTVPVLAGWVRRCPADGSDHYPRTDVAVIMAVVDDDDRLLLARGRGFRSGGMSVLAGFVEPGETLAAAVVREVGEEVGVEVEEVTYLGDQPWPFPSSLMVGFRARARSTALRLQEDEIAAARWFTRDELAAAVADGSLVIPGRVSIARRLLEHWYGGRLQAPDVSTMR